jgi:glycosyltransferase involved in cell wall biosynthesis
MMIRELPDPFVQEKSKEPALWLRVRPVLGRIKRRWFSWLEPKALPPSPVIGFTGGAIGPLKKRALLVYLVQALNKSPEELRKAPTNTVQSLEIARALNRLGYTVDAVDWQDKAFVPERHYDVCVGMHYNYGRLLPMLKAQRTINIYYATGAYWQFENEAEAARSDYLLKRRGIDIRLPERLTANDWAQESDAIVALGDGFNEALYTPHNKQVFSIDHVAIPSTPPNFESKDFQGEARRNFLCIVGTGLLHKGVDLVLEAFAGLGDCHLWLCGGLHPNLEEEFMRAYRKELFDTPNIHPVGVVDRQGLNQLGEMCIASVHASCSESMATSVLDTMVRGLIPIVTRESGVSTEGLGMTFREATVEEIQRCVLEMANTPPEVCRKMAKDAYQTAITRYTLERYIHNMEQILRTILAE